MHMHVYDNKQSPSEWLQRLYGNNTAYCARKNIIKNILNHILLHVISNFKARTSKNTSRVFDSMHNCVNRSCCTFINRILLQRIFWRY